MEGSVFVGGAVVQWLRDELGLIGSAAESEYFAEQVPDNGGVYGGACVHGAGCAILGHVRPRHHLRA